MGKIYKMGKASFATLEGKLDYILKLSLSGLDMLRFDIKEGNIPNMKETVNMIIKDISKARKVLEKIKKEKP